MKPEIIYINNGDNEQTWLNRVNLNHSVKYVRKDLYDEAIKDKEMWFKAAHLQQQINELVGVPFKYLGKR